jgi:hypothetical protein
MSPALRPVGRLDILSSMPPVPSVAPAGKLPDAPCIHARLRRLATKPGEESGLEDNGAVQFRVASIVHFRYKMKSTTTKDNASVRMCNIADV